MMITMMMKIMILIIIQELQMIALLKKSHIVIRNTWWAIATIVKFKILNYGYSKELDYCIV